MMDELVNKLAELQAELEDEERKADFASSAIDRHIIDAKARLANLEKERDINRQPYIEAVEEIKTTIEDLCKTIIDEWDRDKKTLTFAAGTLRFRTTTSLKINNETLVLIGLLDHTSVDDVATKYIKGFNLTAVKKYMSVLDLPMGAAELSSKITVKLAMTETTT